jgi:sugar/nucleoside kinase (ribokinase family)
MYSVYGIGNPLLDFVTHQKEEFVQRLQTRPGTMNLVSAEEMAEILSRVRRYCNIPGGSCANTIRGLAWLGGDALPPAVYSGAVGDDERGICYRRIIETAGIVHRLAVKKSATGCSLIVVTPDRERTMFTHLGACRELGPADIDYGLLKKSQILYFTGFMWDSECQKQAALEAADFALKREIPIAFDLADPFVVERYGREFRSWIPGRVKILFGNEEEVRLLFQTEAVEEEIAAAAGGLAETVLIKTGAGGCLLVEGNSVKHVPTAAVAAVDTTAAGDCFAAGFLLGRLRGLSSLKAAEQANRLASAIVTVDGCDFTLLEQGGASWEGER